MGLFRAYFRSDMDELVERECARAHHRQSRRVAPDICR